MKRNIKRKVNTNIAKRLNLLVKILISLVVCAFLVSASFAQTKKTNRNKKQANTIKEQTSFGSEGEIKNKVKVPKAIIEQLSEYENGQLKRCQSGDWSEPNIANHFAASKLNINDDGQQDLVIQAQTSCFMGAHNTTFWIFAEVKQRLSLDYELVFDIQSDFLKVLDTSTNGYRDIESASHTALELYTTVWKFDGQTYQPRECKIESFETKKVTRVKCGDD